MVANRLLHHDPLTIACCSLDFHCAAGDRTCMDWLSRILFVVLMAGLQVCLGQDELQCVLSHLEPRAVALVARTSRTFNQNASSESLWRAFEEVQRASAHSSFPHSFWAQAGDGSSAKMRWQLNKTCVEAHADAEIESGRSKEEEAERAERLVEWKAGSTKCIDRLGTLVGSGTPNVEFTPTLGTLELPVTKHIVLTLLRCFARFGKCPPSHMPYCTTLPLR